MLHRALVVDLLAFAKTQKLNSKSRIGSILQASTLASEITGVETFNLSSLDIPEALDFTLPTKLRLGHLAEKIFTELVHSSSNFRLLHENIQINENGNTVGELDFILEGIDSKQVSHVELAFKFYLLDPSISSEPINNWIGPNRNDSLIEKLTKLKTRQFPLLYHSHTISRLGEIDTSQVSQALCFLVSLYVPYNYTGVIKPLPQEAIKGYYLDFNVFSNLDTSDKAYYLPPKSEWGMNPNEQQEWSSFQEISSQITASLGAKKAVLCWQKLENTFKEFFIVWW